MRTTQSGSKVGKPKGAELQVKTLKPTDQRTQTKEQLDRRDARSGNDQW